MTQDLAARVCPSCGAQVAASLSRCGECGVKVPPAQPVIATSPATTPTKAPTRLSAPMLVLVVVMGAVVGVAGYAVWSNRGPELGGSLQDGNELPARPLPTVRPPPTPQEQADGQRDKLLAHIEQLKRRLQQRSGGGDTARAWNGLSAFERKAKAAQTPAELQSLWHSLRDWESATIR